MPIKVVINNFNRAGLLKRLIEWLLKSPEAVEIHIVDNNSSYGPTFSLYEKLSKQVTIHRLGANLGSNAPATILSRLVERDERFVATDPDIVPCCDCPADMFAVMADVLVRYPEVAKVGPALRLDRIPADYPMASMVIDWERSLYGSPLPCFRGVHAAIDTTMAMYRSLDAWGILDQQRCVRLFYPYVAEHVDWYQVPEIIDEEYEYYLSTAGPGSTYANRMREYRTFQDRLLRVKQGAEPCNTGQSAAWIESLIGTQYRMRNVSCDSETTMTATSSTSCTCWSIDHNLIEVVGEGTLLVTYVAGNHSRDLLTFSPDAQSFHGYSDQGWEIVGKRTE